MESSVYSEKIIREIRVIRAKNPPINYHFCFAMKLDGEEVEQSVSEYSRYFQGNH